MRTRPNHEREDIGDAIWFQLRFIESFLRSIEHAVEDSDYTETEIPELVKDLRLVCELIQNTVYACQIKR